MNLNSFRRRYVGLGTLIACGVFTSLVHAKDRGSAVSTEDANRALVAAFAAAWNAHDMVAFGRLLAPDVDWVNVDGYRGRGREQVESGHARVHATKFKDSVMTIHQVEVAPLAPNVALLHITWALRGDRNNDGTAREPREGIFTWVTTNAGDGWKIRASHNSNKGVIR